MHNYTKMFDADLYGIVHKIHAKKISGINFALSETLRS